MVGDRGMRAIHDYYERGKEQDRLASPRGIVEFERTKEIVRRHLPQAASTVADIGGGPGRYALWLSELGHQVIHRDLVPLHVDQLAQSTDGLPNIDTAVGDARDLDLDDASVDAVLMLGPLYHLDHREDRVRALGEAYRVVRPGGAVFVAAISRWAARLDGVLRLRLYDSLPDAVARIGDVERTGHMTPLFPGSFCGYSHRPGQLRAEIRSAGLEMVDLVAIEGATYLLADLDERMTDDEDRKVVLDTARALERVPELLGASPHLLATARRASVGS